MDVKVDSYIADAIVAFVENNGITFRRLAEMMGVSGVSITKWRRIGCGITAAKWERLFPLIKPYLPEERIYLDDAGIPRYSSTVQRVSSYFFEAKYLPQSVPLFSLEQLATLNQKIETAQQLGERMGLDSVEYRPRHQKIKDVVAVILQNDDYAPIMPVGTMIYACTREIPKSGGLVICKAVGKKIPFLARFEHNTANRHIAVFPVHSTKDDKPILEGAGAEIDDAVTWFMPILHYEVIVYK